MHLTPLSALHFVRRGVHLQGSSYGDAEEICVGLLPYRVNYCGVQRSRITRWVTLLLELHGEVWG